VGFFDPPPPRPDPLPEPLQPEWAGPPDNVIGTPLALRLVLARTADVAVALTNAWVYPTGATLGLTVRARTVTDALERMTMRGGPFHSWAHRAGSNDANEIPPEVLRFGVQFSDGRKATTVGHDPWNGDVPPAAPVMFPAGGSGGDRVWDMSYWLWPLPPTGPLAFVVEWPGAGVALTRTEIEASQIIEAASRAEELWPAQPGRDRQPAGFSGSSQMALGWTGYGSVSDEHPGDASPGDHPPGN